MYDRVMGRLIEKSATHAVVAAGGVGYRIEIPLSTFERLPEPGAEVVLYTVARIQDDEPRLFGFASQVERRVFRQLTEAVSGIGPRKALAILSSAATEELAQAIESGDVRRLQRIRGVGPKLAQRLVLELRERLTPILEEGAGPAASIRKDVVEALVSLGYTRDEAERAVRKASERLQPAAPLEEWVRAALAGG
jgi:Holliday junction DNA helicase RuvA